MTSTRILSAAITISLLSVGFLFLSPNMDVSGSTRSSQIDEGDSLWNAEVAFEGNIPDYIDGLAFGDADSNRDGNEIVWTSRDMKVFMGYYNDAGEFSYDDIWTSGGQQLTPAIGDLRPDIDGNEILVVGLSSGMEDDNAGAGTAEVLSRPGTGWQNERVFTEEKLIHGCDVGDLDPTIPGEEGILVSFGWNVTMVWWDTGESKWNSSHIFTDIGNVRKVVIADLLPDHEGNELVAVSKGGRVTIAYGNKDNWTVDVIFEDPTIGFARVAVGDVDNDPSDLEIYTGTDTHEIIGFKRDGESWTRHNIYKDTDKNRGVWVGDVDPNIPGNELYAFGYSAKLFQITGSLGAGWNVKTIWKDVARGHEIRIGDIHPNEGNEIAIVGYSTNVTIISLSGWESQIAFQGEIPDYIDGLAFGDADSNRDGNEIVWTSRDMKVFMGYYNDAGEFSYDDIWTSGGQQLTPAIGDLRPDIDGNEILVVGLSSGMEDDNAGAGTAEVLSRPGTGWQNERVFTEEKLIHGCDVGDLDPTIPGEEGILVSFGWNVTMVWWDTGESKWNSSHIFTDIGNVRKVVIADLLPDHEGNELVAVSKGGRVTIAYGNKDNWTVDVIFEDPTIGFARVAVGDVDNDPSDLEIYTGTDTHEIIGFKRDGESWTRHNIYKDTDKNRGVWVGDVDPNIPGNELYAFGYSAKLFQITGSLGAGWNVKTIWKDVARGHEIRIGDIHPNEGNEIAIVGYSTNVTIISMMNVEGAPEPLVTGGATQTIGSGGENTYGLEIQSDSKMYFSVNDVDDLEVTLFPESMYSSGSLNLKVKAGHVTEDTMVTVTVTIDYGSGTLNFPIDVTITEDTTEPSLSGMLDQDGNIINSGDKVLWNDTIIFEYSEPISAESFLAAETGETLKLEWGGKVMKAEFELSKDGRTMTVHLEPLEIMGTITFHFDGLKDEVGLNIAQDPIELQVEGKEEDPNNAWIVIIVVLIALVLISAGIFFYINIQNKPEDEDGDERETRMPPEPKQI